MANTPTPHIEARPGDIAGTVLMPGDPLRAKFIAETYLENPVCFNQVRNMLGFTGVYQGKRVSVMGGGMGMPSIGIYSYELFHFYDVETIIRIGSAGGLGKNVKLRDVVIGMASCTDSHYASQYNLPGTIAPVGGSGGEERDFSCGGKSAVFRYFLQRRSDRLREMAGYGRSGRGDGIGGPVSECDAGG